MALASRPTGPPVVSVSKTTPSATPRLESVGRCRPLGKGPTGHVDQLCGGKFTPLAEIQHPAGRYPAENKNHKRVGQSAAYAG